MPTGLLVELEALGNVLEANAEWHADAPAIRARMLRILSLVASRYLSSGLQTACCCSGVLSLDHVALRAVLQGMQQHVKKPCCCELQSQIKLGFCFTITLSG